jgi:AcrR family transcriptional regulator
MGEHSGVGGHGTRAKGRPRSEHARQAVLEAADDLLVEVGYAAMTMKGIAERAGVGRQTVYRWWTNKAEVLLEACVADAEEELDAPPRADPADDMLAYLTRLGAFLATSPAGIAYRALIGEAQHDPAVGVLVRRADVLSAGARRVLGRVRPALPAMPDDTLATAQFIGPVLSEALIGSRPLSAPRLRRHVALLLAAWDRTAE